MQPQISFTIYTNPYWTSDREYSGFTSFLQSLGGILFDAMRCLTDQTICKTKQVEDIVIDYCPLCNGVWLEKEEIRKLVRYLNIPEYYDADELFSKWNVTAHTGTAPKDFWVEDNYDCPNGHGHMKKHYFAGSTIGVDQCHTCWGMWFDGGELHAVATYVEPNPALEVAWREYFRDKKKLEDQLSKFGTGFATTVATAAVNPQYLLTAAVVSIARAIFEYATKHTEHHH